MTKWTAFVGIIIPTIALGQTFKTDYLLSIVNGVIQVLSALFPLLLALAVLFFIWGVVVFIAKAGDEKARTQGRQHIMWGIVSIFVILSVWGFVALLQNIFKFDDGTPASYVPQSKF